MCSRGREGEARPRAGSEVSLNRRPKLWVRGGDSDGLVFVNSKTRNFGELTYQRESRGDKLNRVGEKSKIVSEGEGPKVGFLCDKNEEGVVGDNEEERGEGAPLFNSSLD